MWLFLSSCGTFWAAVALFEQLWFFLSSCGFFLSSCDSLPDYKKDGSFWAAVALLEQLWLFISNCVSLQATVALSEQLWLSARLSDWWLLLSRCGSLQAAVALFEQLWLFLSSCGSFWAAVALYQTMRMSGRWARAVRIPSSEMPAHPAMLISRSLAHRWLSASSSRPQSVIPPHPSTFSTFTQKKHWKGEKV